MDYIRSFYRQEGEFETNLRFVNNNSSSGASFGISGQNSINFHVSGDFVKLNSFICSSLDENKSIEFSICGKSGNATIWHNGYPISVLNPTGFSFDSIYCNSGPDSFFYESVKGQKPNINNSFSGWQNSNKSGNIFISHDGKYDLEVNSFSIDNSVIIPDFSPFTLASGTSGKIPVIFSGNSNFSGTGVFSLETNAGDYSFSRYFNNDFSPTLSQIDVFIEENIFNPSGSTVLNIQNNGSIGASVEIFFDYLEKGRPNFNAGSATYPNPTGSGYLSVNYSDSGFYRPILGSGGFSVSGTGQSGFSVSYSGNFTGIGGRLGATGIQTLSNSSDIVITGAISGSNPYYIYNNVDVYEGNGNEPSFWSVIYQDVDRGAEDFRGLSRYTSSGLGLTGVKYRIPANSTTTALISYSSDYYQFFSQSLLVRVTDYDSINKSAYIQIQ